MKNPLYRFYFPRNFTRDNYALFAGGTVHAMQGLVSDFANSLPGFLTRAKKSVILQSKLKNDDTQENVSSFVAVG